MTDKIEPALTESQWEARNRGDQIMHPLGAPDVRWNQMSRSVTIGPPVGGASLYAADAPKWIALLNAALPDTDPRKITREWTHNLRTVADFLEHLSIDESANLIAWEERGHAAIRLREYAAALESYLPPIEHPKVGDTVELRYVERYKPPE